MSALPGLNNLKGLTQFQLSSCKIAHGIGMKVDSQEAAWPYTQGTTVLWAEVFPLLLTEQILTTIVGKSPSDDNCLSLNERLKNSWRNCKSPQIQWKMPSQCFFFSGGLEKQLHINNSTKTVSCSSDTLGEVWLTRKGNFPYLIPCSEPRAKKITQLFLTPPSSSWVKSVLHPTTSSIPQTRRRNLLAHPPPFCVGHCHNKT